MKLERPPAVSGAGEDLPTLILDHPGGETEPNGPTYESRIQELLGSPFKMK